jgi:hypothetical protein
VVDAPGNEIANEVERLVGKGLVAAGYFLLERVQELISVEAPRRLTKGGRIVAATRAIPGAPPRKLTGALRGSGFVREVDEKRVDVVFATPYARRLEFDMNHPYMIVALNQHLSDLGRIVGDELTGTVSGADL